MERKKEKEKEKEEGREREGVSLSISISFIYSKNRVTSMRYIDKEARNKEIERGLRCPHCGWGWVRRRISTNEVVCMHCGAIFKPQTTGEVSV